MSHFTVTVTVTVTESQPQSQSQSQPQSQSQSRSWLLDSSKKVHINFWFEQKTAIRIVAIKNGLTMGTRMLMLKLAAQAVLASDGEAQLLVTVTITATRFQVTNPAGEN